MVSGDVDEIWEDTSSAATILSPKSNVLAAWRLEPSLLLNQSCPSKDSMADAWIAQASQRDMESLTLALQKELCSRNERKLANSTCSSASQWKGAAWNWQGSDTAAWSVKTECASDAGSPMTSSEIDNTGSPVNSNIPGNALKLQPFGGTGLAGGHGVHQAASNASMAAACATAKQYVNPLGARGSAGTNAGKVNKRRSRAANKSPITFLAADPANFRAMVQQVTGFPFTPNAGHARFCSPAGGVGAPLLRPEPTRPPSSSHTVNNIQGLPTLDTSALLIDSNMLTGRAPGPQQCRADVPVSNFVHLSSLVQPQRPLPSLNNSLSPTSPSQHPCANFPNSLRVDPLAKSSSNLSSDAGTSMRGELLTQKLKAACLKANVSILHSVDQSQSIDFPDFKPPKSSISADSFLPAESEHPDHPRCNMIPNVIHDNNIPLDSWFSADGLINSS